VDWLTEEKLICIEEWDLVAEVAEHYPRLLSWLAEGQVGVLWNVFGVWVGMLRLVPGVRWLLWYLIFARVARVAPWRVALYESILQDKRKQINAKSPAPEGTEEIPRSGMPGLSAVTDEPVILPTAVGEDLDARIATMSSGCVGVSGLRGAGKSTLIQDFCAHRYGTPRYAKPRSPLPGRTERFLPGLRIMVRAPLRFEAREFLIHQYTCLCQAVLADVRFNPTTLTRQLLLPFTPGGRVRLGALLGALSGAIFFAGCAVLCCLAAGVTWPRSLTDEDLFRWEVAGAAVAAVAGMMCVGWRTKRAAREIRQVVNLASDAESRLQRLHYQRKDTRSAGGTLSAPMGMQVDLGTSHEFTQQLMSLPELIDDYRDFVQRVVGGLEEAENKREQSAWRARVHTPARKKRQLRRLAQRARLRQDALERPWLLQVLCLGIRASAEAGKLRDAAALAKSQADADRTADGPRADVRLVIGIDQMDQIDNPGAACKFLNELSAEFGVPKCVYLLSVSPGTMAAADQRTVPLKTSSSGVFDEVTWVDPFTLPESDLLLCRRVIGLPPVLIALCYVLSGGLPRELLRVARSIVRAVQDAGDGGGTGTARVVDAVIEEEVTALKHRALACAAGADADGTLGLIGKLADKDWPWNTPLPARDPVVDDVRENPELLPVPRLAPASGPPLPQRIAPPDGGASAVAVAAEVRSSFTADMYFLLTVRGLFEIYQAEISDRATSYLLEVRASPGRPYRAEPGELASLARARIALAVSPGLAADLVSRAREAASGFPRPQDRG
jgi:hypothetical protein